jgi:hypothetical protein
MDDVQNRVARELADAIAAAVAQSAGVEACRERAREAGYRLKVTLDAIVGFAALPGHQAPEGGSEGADPATPSDEPSVFEVSANDRRFLRSLRIAADETKVEEPN